jgi:hypothetical protein
LNEDEVEQKTTFPYKRDTEGDFVPDGTFYIPFAGAAKRYRPVWGQSGAFGALFLTKIAKAYMDM